MGDARRYLYYLIVTNAGEKSCLPEICEVESMSSSDRESERSIMDPRVSDPINDVMNNEDAPLEY